MNDRLTERQVIRLHRMKSEGFSNRAIADALSISPDTVYNHISMRVSYPAEVYQKIGKHPKLINSAAMSIHDAAIFLPGWPSRDKTYRLYKAGILKATLQQSASESHPRKHLVTTRAQIKQCAKEMLPTPGIFISYWTLSHLSPALLFRLSGRGERLKYWPSRLQIFYPMPEVTELSARLEIPLNIPAGLIHRAVTVLESVGVATI